MQLTPIILGAGGNARLALTGDYFRLVTANAAVTVRLYRKGRPFAEAAGILGGYWAKPTDGFDEVEVISVTAQTVIVGTAYGLGGYDRAAGDVNITNAKIDVADKGVAYGSSFTSITSLVGGTNETILAPGSNANGVIICNAVLCNGAPAGVVQNALLAKAGSAPTMATDGELLLAIMVRVGTAVGNLGAQIALPRALEVAAAKGLYRRNTGAANDGEVNFGIQYLLK